MIKGVIETVLSAARSLFRKWQVAAAFGGLFLVLVAVAALFVVTGQASIGQLLLTLVLGGATLIIFFTLQAMAVSYTQGGESLSAFLRRALRDFWKLAVVSLPIILLGWLIIYLLDKLQARSLAAALPPPSARNSRPPVQWLGVIATTLWYLLLFLALPLATFHLWIAAAREGVGAAFRGAGRVLARAFAPRSVLIYAVGFVAFVVVPYFLLFTRTPAGRWWLDVGLLAVRVVLALVIAFFGWVITLGALALASEKVKEG